MINRRWMWRVPVPNEMDGGSVVSYYQLKRMNMISPTDEHFCVPKVPEELDASYLPWVNFFVSDNPVNDIPSLISQYQVPVTTLFHIGRDEIDKLLDPIHNVGGKIILWQTIHWPDDDIMKLQRLSAVDKIVAPTEYAKRVFQSVGKIPPEKVEVIPHGVDTNRFYKRKTILEREFGIDKRNQKVILYSGRLSTWKGVHQIIPIMRQLIDQFNCVFIIRGGAFQGLELSDKFSLIFHRLSTNNPNIIFMPEWRSPEFMEEMYGMTDIVLANFAHEGFSVPLIEAQASGAVPVATAIPPHVEIMGNSGDVGILLDPRMKVGEVNDGTPLYVASSDQLYGSVKWLLENPDEVEAMARRGVRNVKTRFELTDVSNKWFKLYDELCPSGYNMNKTMEKNLDLG